MANVNLVQLLVDKPNHITCRELIGAWREKHAQELVDFSDANLSGMDLSGSYLEDANFSGAKLVGTSLSGANLLRANFVGANMQNADLSRARLKQ